MVESIFRGSRIYWGWILLLLLTIATGFGCYLQQLESGLGITGLSRDVSWGIYIAQFTFFVGVAASAVTLVLPCYLHDVKEFARITILGELLAVASVMVCMLFILVDMGQPGRVFNVLLYPSPSSLMFWDMLSLSGYLLINGVIAAVMLNSEYMGKPAPGWIKPLVILSIPWAISIHTVTAFLYSGLPGRALWFTAILAPRFLASAFASGPALLILLCLLLRRLTSFDAGEIAIRKLGIIMTYAMTANVFFLAIELFTPIYSKMPDHLEPLELLYNGFGSNSWLSAVIWISALLAAIALITLLFPKFRNNEKLLAMAAVAVFISLWLEKGLALVVAGFIPSPLGAVAGYMPTLPEAAIVMAIWGFGALLVTLFYKIMVSVREGR